jgi:uncharacterized protein YcbK (DUF882 family)
MAGLIACPWRASRHAALAALLIVFSSENLQTAVADGDTRTLTMHHMHTGEDISITFKRNGQYDDAALQKLNNFLRDWRREESTKMDPHLLDLIWEVYREVGGQQPIQIVCGFRSPQTNAMLRRRSSGVARFSQHTLGKAIDFYIPGVALEQIRYAGLRMQRGGVGFYPTSGSPFIHLDTGSVRHWPRMSNEQLARVLSTRTKFAHDKRPAGYQTALAEIERRNADAGDEQPVAQRSKRGLIQRLFGFGEDEEEDVVAAATPAAAKPTGTAARTAAKSEPAKSEPAKQQLAAAVPLPPVRPPRPNQPAKPAQAARPAPAQYSLASLESAPAPSPADIVRSRGMWETATPATAAPATPPPATQSTATPPPAAPSTAAGDVKAPPPGALASGGQRFVWLTGPQGRPVEPAPTRTAAAEPPRPPAEIPNVDQETTASLASWPERTDRAPAQVTLAYAAPPPRDLEAEGSAPLAGTSARLTPSPAAGATRSLAAPAALATANRLGQRSDNPWLRGLVIAPSVHYSMSVAAFGAPDYRQLARLMQKPSSVLAMTFTADPQAGITSYSFSGSAVAFLPTVSFTRTAALN